MKDRYRILAINPGSTSTKIALFENTNEIFYKNINHDYDILKNFHEVNDQLMYRKDIIIYELNNAGINLNDIDAFVGRGGSLVSVKCGTYVVNEILLEHARKGIPGQHPAQLASQICNEFALTYGGKAFVVNPPDVDEFDDISRITGLKNVYRESRIHTLNQKEVALKYCERIGKRYNDLNLLVAHIGGGISVTAHKKGRMVDSNDILNQDGPMTPTRTGALPAVTLSKLCFSGKYSEEEIYAKLINKGGLIDHLGTSDARKIEERIEGGDKDAKLIYDAMIYQICKCIGSYAVTLKGEMEAIILTGGLAKSKYLVESINKYISWIADVVIMPGEVEMEALAGGALHVMIGKECALEYTGIPVWNGFGF